MSRADELQKYGFDPALKKLREHATRIIHELEAAPIPAWLAGEITEFIPNDIPEWVRKAMDEGQYFTVTLARIREMEAEVAKQENRLQELEKGVRMARFELDQVQIDGEAGQLAAAITDADEQLEELNAGAFE